jgi:hypothetical protein
MHTDDELEQGCVGLHCVPRFELEPQTSYVPLAVVTGLHWLN